MQNRFKQKHYRDKMRFSTQDAEENKERTFTLEGKTNSYFVYQMYSNHVYDQTMTWGDLYRVFKYFYQFQSWDASSATRLFRVVPSILNN